VADHLLEVSGLTKSYKKRRVVNGINIHIDHGEIVGLLGPNGAGKTTSFYLIVGLVKPDSGNIIFNDSDVSSLPMFKRARLGLGYLSQEPSIFRKMTVEDNIVCILETLSLTKAERLDRLKHLLDGLGLTSLAKQKAYTLSGGERRRLEITRALVTNPSFIMLDEPFSGVDPLAVSEVQKLIENLKDRGLGILITDHNVRETLAIVDRAYLIYEGKIICEGDREFLINDQKAKEVYLGQQFVE
jgi:lipopolysaccharide export system ATP-binding protein